MELCTSTMYFDGPAMRCLSYHQPLILYRLTDWHGLIDPHPHEEKEGCADSRESFSLPTECV